MQLAAMARTVGLLCRQNVKLTMAAVACVSEVNSDASSFIMHLFPMYLLCIPPCLNFSQTPRGMPLHGAYERKQLRLENSLTLPTYDLMSTRPVVAH